MCCPDSPSGGPPSALTRPRVARSKAPLLAAWLAATVPWLPALAAAPELTLDRSTAQPRLLFAGALESAPSPLGPWTDVPGASSPFPLQTLGETQRYFRTRGTPTVPGLFDFTSVLSMSLEGPLQHHFELAFAGLPDGIFPPRREKPYFDGRVVVGSFDRPASVRVRGNSSLQECPFPKLKFKIAREDRTNTPFAEAREIKVGTHCSDEGGRGPVGRLREEIATYREALAYEVMGALEFVTPRVRRARIEYHDVTPPRGESPTGWTATRLAFVLEDPEVLGERLGGRALSEEEVAKLSGVTFDAQLLADLELLHALLGNWDFALPPDGRGLWNTDVLELPGPVYLLVAGDFDLASLVTGAVQNNAPPHYRPDLPELERETFFQVSSLHGRVGPERFAAGRERFQARRPVVESLIQGAVVDEPGRTNALAHVSAFFRALEEAVR